jgi:GTP cyclohydrolase IIa
MQLKLIGYREWTETLGFRREHIIQQIQAELHKRIWAGFTEADALPHQMRYDFSLVYSNNVPLSKLVEVVKSVKEISPVPVEYCVGRGDTPLEAYASCDGSVETEGGSAVVGHMDIVNSTAQTEKRGPYDIYVMANELLNKVNSVCRGLGCLAFYLGGDNIMVFLPDVKTAYEVYDQVYVDVRLGVGVAQRPYAAFAKATEALDSMRRDKIIGVRIIR